MADIASSRIFVKGLPPTFTDAEFRRHFAHNRDITDAKIFPNRRIGYVGYRTPEDAQKAVKYFNKTFIRMSRIGVELARPIQDAKSVKQNTSAPTARRQSGAGEDALKENELKRKREGEAKEEEDPKLKEFLDAYKPKSKRKAWEAEGMEVPAKDAAEPDVDVTDAVAGGQSDDEYEVVPKKAKRAKHEPDAPVVAQKDAQDTADTPPEPEQQDVPMPDTEKSPTEGGANDASKPAVSDADWARSRTSRLLGLLDEDEEEVAATRQQAGAMSDSDVEEAYVEPKGAKEPRRDEEAVSSMPTPPSEDQEAPSKATHNNFEKAESSMRLFIRNLPYDVRQADLQVEFEPFGFLEEVRWHLSSLHTFNVMNILIGTAYANGSC